MRNASNILRHELIGLEIEVTASKNPSLIGKKGTIANETKNTIHIKDGGREITLLKHEIVFRTVLEGKTVEIEGKMLIGRPEDRVKS